MSGRIPRHTAESPRKSKRPEHRSPLRLTCSLQLILLLAVLSLPLPAIVPPTIPVWTAARGAEQPAVNLGIDTFLADPRPLRGRRIGLVTHQAGVTRDGRLTGLALAHIPGIRLTALFAPEHGLDGSRG